MGLVIPQESDLLDVVKREKEHGNELLRKGDFLAALNVYAGCITELIVENDGGLAACILNSPEEVKADMSLRLLPAILTNAALCCIKLETYSQAIDYATLALKLSKHTFVKGYFRRGTAYVLLRKFKPAVNDFKRLTAAVPHDADANLRLKEAERLLSLERFAAAIAGQHQTKPSQTLSQNDWAISSGYKGPVHKRGDKIDAAFFQSLCGYFSSDHQNRIDKKVILDILLDTIDRLAKLPNVVPVTVNSGERLIVCGDVHGQFYDLLNIFRLYGEPSPTNRYLFNGDFVDRGSFSVEVICVLYVAALIWPDSIYMTRGNHESKDMTSMYGFAGEVRAKCTDALYELFLESFEHLPLAHTIGADRPKVFVVHGGLSTEPESNLAGINRLDRLEDSTIRTDLLWADPQPMPGTSPSKRGVSKHFGPDITLSFLKENNLDLVVRSHEMMMGGYQSCHAGHLVTVFSAPNYCDQMNNLGAVLVFTKESLDEATSPDDLYEAKTFEAVKTKPNIPAMHYSQLFRQGGML